MQFTPPGSACSIQFGTKITSVNHHRQAVKAGERVVVEGTQKIRDGTTVKLAGGGRGGGRLGMSKFFIDRPIVAIVIAILMVIVGAISILSLPV